MITTRLLRVVKNAGIGLSSYEITEWIDALSLAVSAGVLRLGDYNTKLINSVSLAWCSKPFNTLPVYEYTHGELPTSWIDADMFKIKAKTARIFIKLPNGHPVKALYKDGHVVEVLALTAPGEYTADVTDSLLALFPAGVDPKITTVYAIVSASESDWSCEAWRTGMLLSGERGFIAGVDRITISWVDGCDLQQFCDFGILGALSIPVIEPAESADKIMENVENSRCILIAVTAESRCALYCSRVQTGEIEGIRTISSAGTVDFAYLELDTGDMVYVSDLLALRDKSEGSEVYYLNMENCCVMSDEYGNSLLGSYSNLFE